VALKIDPYRKSKILLSVLVLGNKNPPKMRLIEVNAVEKSLGHPSAFGKT
jgi:hypothetical protein